MSIELSSMNLRWIATKTLPQVDRTLPRGYVFLQFKRGARMMRSLHGCGNYWFALRFFLHGAESLALTAWSTRPNLCTWRAGDQIGELAAMKAFMQGYLAAAALLLAWIIILPLGAAAACCVSVQRSMKKRKMRSVARVTCTKTRQRHAFRPADDIGREAGRLFARSTAVVG